MAHVMKMTKAACGHMFKHYERAKDKNGEYVKFGNESIDPERTPMNYNLAPDRELSQGDFVRKRCSEVYCMNRKDVNVLCSWVVTVPKDVPEVEHEKFFHATYDFLEKRYGRENVVSAYVHMDEVTPHMHFAFVPVIYDKKKERYKVSAFEVIDRRELTVFHAELEKHLESVLGHEVGILNEATKEGNKSIEELKRGTAQEKLKIATLEASRIVSKAQTQAQGINDSLIAVKAEYEAKKAYVREADRVSDVSMMYPAEAKVTEKGLIHKQKFVTVPAEMWETKHISANEKRYLQKANQELEKQIEAFKSTASAQNLSALTRRVEELEEENRSLKYRNQALKSKVSKAEREADKTIEKVNKVLGKLPEDMADRFVKEWKAPERSRSRGFDMER